MDAAEDLVVMLLRFHQNESMYTKALNEISAGIKRGI